MTVNLDEAIEKMKASGDWEYEQDSLWSDQDIVDYETETGSLMPEVLKGYGWNGFGRPDKNAVFVAGFEDGTRSVHESQNLVSSRKTIYKSYRMRIANPNWPDKFTLPMLDGRDRLNNKVYRWEQASDAFGTGKNARGLGLVAPSLFEFFYNLKRSDEI